MLNYELGMKKQELRNKNLGFRNKFKRIKNKEREKKQGIILKRIKIFFVYLDS